MTPAISAPDPVGTLAIPARARAISVRNAAPARPIGSTVERRMGRSRGIFLPALALIASVLAFMAAASSVSASVRYVTQWGTLGGGNGQFGGPVALATSPSGKVLASDLFTQGLLQVARVQQFTNTGTWEATFGSYGTLPGQFTWPGAVAVAPNGDFYVGDYALNRIQRFNSNGLLIGGWGSPGSGVGQFASPWGIAIDLQGRVYVVDYGNSRIQKFGPAGNFLDQWGSFGSGNGQFLAPSFIATGPDGNVYVADSGNSRIQKFSAGGQYLDQWASPGPGAGPPDFPLGIAIDPHGDVFVAGTNSIRKYSSGGSLLTRWGEYGKGDGQFRNPQGIATDSNGNVYVGDSGNSRIQKFHDAGPPYPDPGTARLRIRRSGAIAVQGGGSGMLPVRVKNTGSNVVRQVRICAPRNVRARGLIRAVRCHRLGSIEAGRQKITRLRVAARCVSAGRVNLGLRATASNASPAAGATPVRITTCQRLSRPTLPWGGRG